MNYVASADSLSFQTMPQGWTAVPLWPEHPGGFAARRKHDVHCGVDLYCTEGTPVYTVERGIVIDPRLPFTGGIANPDWTDFWEDTYAVLVQGKSGIVIYGEINPLASLKKGMRLKTGQQVGNVLRVLKQDKGRPRSMLHLELHKHWAGDDPVWELDEPKPPSVMDPTPHMLEAIRFAPKRDMWTDLRALSRKHKPTLDP
ncbi:MAG: M23 family metallopeptidase [Alphaproteobacteria bacterium]|nr:M23 family metallopeptidase [Alphaproteobacteria bacterium]